MDAKINQVIKRANSGSYFFRMRLKMDLELYTNTLAINTLIRSNAKKG